MISVVSIAWSPGMPTSLVLLLACASATVLAQSPSTSFVVFEETVVAKVERIEKPQRVVTLRTPDNRYQTIAVDPSMTVFDELQTGDTVTVRYQETVTVKPAPNAKLSPPRETTDEARKAGKKVVEQLTAVVRIVDVNRDDGRVTFRTAEDTRGSRFVRDKRLLEGLRSGDQIEITLTRERAVKITRR
jgi:hypothetical protein